MCRTQSKTNKLRWISGKVLIGGGVRKTEIFPRKWWRIRGALFYDIAHLFPANCATSKCSYITVMIDERFRPRSRNSGVV